MAGGRSAWWLALALVACAPAADPGEDAALPAVDQGPDAAAADAAVADGGGPTRPCPAGWAGPPDDCRPPPLADDCPAGSLAIVGGGCTAPWICPEGWIRAPSGFGCAWPAADAAEPPLPCPLGADCRPVACGPGALRLRACVARPACAPPPAPADAVFVGPDAPPGAVAEALATGRPVVLAAGRYPVGHLVLPDGARLQGACPDRTRLAGSVEAAGVAHLGHLAVEAPADAPALLGEPIEINLLFVDLTGGVELASGALRAEHLDARGGPWRLGARLTCAACALDAALQLAAEAELASAVVAALHATAPLTLRDARVDGDVVLDAEARLTSVVVAGGGVAIGGDARLADVWVTDAPGAALRVGVDGDATVEGLGIARAGSRDAAAIEVAGRLDATGVWAADLAGVALRTSGRGVTEARDLDVRDVAAAACLQAGDDAEVTVVDAHLRRCQTLGVAVAGQARLSLERVAVADTRPDAQGRLGRGLELAERGRLALTDVQIRGAHDVGVALFGRGAGSEARLTRVAISAVRPDAATGGSGKGLVAFGAVAVDSDDVWIADTVENGAMAAAGAVWRGRGLAVRDVARPAGATASVGLHVADRADVDLTRVDVGGAWGVAVGTAGGASGEVRLRLADALAADVHRVEAGVRLCVISLAAGDGDQDHHLSNLTLRGVPDCGLSVADGEVTVEGLDVGFGVGAQPTTGVRLQRAALALRDAVLRGPAAALRFLDEEASPSTVDVARLRVEGGEVGVHATSAARIRLEDARFDGLATAAVWAQGPAEITAAGLWSRGEGSAFLLESGHLDASDVAVRGAGRAAALVAGARLQLTRAALTDFGPPPGGPDVQAGVLAVAGAEVGLQDSHIAGPTGFGLLADDSTIALAGVHIAGVRADEEGRADAISLLRGRLVGTGLTLADNARAGLVLEAAAGDLRDSTIRGHRVGVVLVADATLESRDVQLLGNERDARACADRCLDRPPAAVP